MKEAFTIFGIVHPTRLCLSVANDASNSIDWEGKEKERFKISYSIKDSQIVLQVEVWKRRGNYWDVRNIVKALLQRQVDARGFDPSDLGGQSVVGLDVELVSLLDHKTNEAIYFIDIEKIFDHGKTPNLPPKFRAYAVQNSYLALALANFREAIRKPDETAFYCYRAFEALVTNDPSSKTTEADWGSFRDALNVTKETLKKHEVESIIRHGRMVPQSWEERKDQLRIAWYVIFRFVMYLDRNCDALPKSNYPVL